MIVETQLYRWDQNLLSIMLNLLAYRKDFSHVVFHIGGCDNVIFSTNE